MAHAAFLRMAHFHLSNEFRDWDTVHNTLTAANALHQALKRTPDPGVAAGGVRRRHQHLSRPLPQYAAAAAPRRDAGRRSRP